MKKVMTVMMTLLITRVVVAGGDDRRRLHGGDGCTRDTGRPRGANGGFCHGHDGGGWQRAVAGHRKASQGGQQLVIAFV